MTVILWISMALIALVALQAMVWMVLWFLAARCDTGWTGPRHEAGPLPLSNPDTPIVRWIDTRRTFATTYKRLLWDEGKGPILAEDRIKAVVDSVPKEFNDRLSSTKDGNVLGPRIYDSWATVVSLHPDVLIVTVRERPWDFRDWYWPNTTGERWDFIKRRVEVIAWHSPLRIHAGTLVPWGHEMHVFSTDPKVENGRLKFDKNRAIIPLPPGKLVLVHHDDDVGVTRE